MTLKSQTKKIFVVLIEFYNKTNYTEMFTMYIIKNLIFGFLEKKTF